MNIQVLDDEMKEKIVDDIKRKLTGSSNDREGIQPRHSGLRVQGTASSPSSTVCRNSSIRRVLVTAIREATGDPQAIGSALDRDRSYPGNLASDG